MHILPGAGVRGLTLTFFPVSKKSWDSGQGRSPSWTNRQGVWSTESGDIHHKEVNALKSKCKSNSYSKIIRFGKFHSISKYKYFTIEATKYLNILSFKIPLIQKARKWAGTKKQSFWKLSNSPEWLISSYKTLW